MPTQVDYNNLFLIQGACHFGGIGYGVGRLKGRNNTFGSAEKLEGLQRILIIHCDIGGTPSLLVVTMLGSYSGVIQPGRNAVGP